MSREKATRSAAKLRHQNNYNYFRDYDPAVGRYIESDPIGLDGGINTFLYADANSVSNIDPTGQNPLAIGAAALRVCMRIPRCAAAAAALTKIAVEACKKIDCTVRFDRKGHPFPTPTGRMELCMHYQIDCHIEGIKGASFSIHSRLPICWKPGEPFPRTRPPSRLP